MDVRATELEPIAAAPALAPVATPTPRAAPRGTGRLFRKYFILILALVTGALLIPSSISLYFSYQETLEVLHEVQREKALAAAGRIEQYIVQVQSQLRGAALPQLGAEGTEQRRLEFLKLLKQVPDVTDIAYIGADGCEKTQVSRLSMDAAGDCLRERGRDPAFLESTSGRPWYGRVYFRKETEPYMQIAVRTGGEKGPVTVADVNLKFMWDVITRIKIGEKGKAYVVDSAGFLIADPDIGLVLRKTDLSGLAHVKATLAGIAGGDAAVVSRDVGGTEVLSAHASIDPLGWKVFVEQPASEVLARLNTSILRIGVLLLGGLIISALVALFLARGMARPIRELQEGAQLIGAGKLDHTIDVKTGDELEALAGQFNRMTGQLRESYAGLERKVDERTRELTHSLEQQTAISEILRVISGSPTDVQPVLDAVAERAARLCNAPFARVLLVDGDVLRPTAEYSSERTPPSTPVPFDRTSLSGRAARDRQTIHIADILPVLDTEFPGARDNILRLGSRAVLSVPLMREGGAYGAIFLYRREPGLFAPDQVALVETFARQAAIAIDNVRLFNETRESLDQQRASGEVLAAISSSISDAAPVFDTILQGCERLFAGTKMGILLVRDGMLHAAALRGTGWDEWSKMWPRPLDRNTVSGIAILDRHAVDFPDSDADDYPAYARTTGALLGYKSLAAAPLIVDGGAIGALWVGRPVKGAFGDKQLAMLRTFADQAVIAIENARLFNETKEALDQQRASGEVLSAISSSVSDTKPVFEAILQSCERLFAGTHIGVVLVRDGMLDAAALRGPGWSEWKKRYPRPLRRDTASAIAILERRVVDFPDVDAADYPAEARAMSGKLGYRSIAAAPLIVEGRVIGALWVGRPVNGAFGDKQLAMLKTFADQAVIAIENARLFNQTKEALEQQTAISEILRVTSGSPTDVQPVLEVVAERAAALCEAQFAQVMLLEDQALVSAASHSVADATAGGYEDPVHMRGPYPLKRTYITGRVALEARTIHHADVSELIATEYPDAAENHRRFGFRAVLGVPLTRDKGVYGVLYVWRREARAFTPDQVALLETFARQAAIAIDNVRLFNETKEALDQQRASGEVLAAISSSISDTQPVFDVILQSCQRLFSGQIVGVILVREDGMLDIGAYRGPGQEGLAKLFPVPVDRNSGSGTAILERRVVDYPDIDADDVPAVVKQGSPPQGVQSLVFAPMLSEGKAIGTLWVGRRQKGAFGEKPMALLRSFADQAVIAIQNARLVNETREALDQQRASGEVLSAISSSIADTKPVFDVILASCERLFDGHNVGVIIVRDDGRLDLGAYAGRGAQELATDVFPMPVDRRSGSGTAVLECRIVEYPDVDAGDIPPMTLKACQIAGMESIVFAPMLSEGSALGVLWVGRSYKGAFGDKALALLRTFADQAVIAIRNARLFKETHEALEQQTGTSEVLKAISRTTFELEPVLATLIENATRLAKSDSGFVYIRDGDLFHLSASHGASPQDVEYMRGNPIPFGPGTLTGRTVLAREVVQIEDAANDPTYMRTEAQKRIGFRTMLGVPMFREGEPIGVVVLWRNEVRQFGTSDVRLASSFADQAVIAIENVRLFREIREKSRQLEIASQHKSEFLANMSHELRTPLNAIIGFSEVLIERMFGELNEKQDDYLKDIHSSGKHLLSLINDILDLSKVEAGRMELEPAAFDVPSALANAMTLVRERAQRHAIALGLDVAPEVEEIVADERKFKQILLNLLTNAVKFTPDGGRVDVAARRVDGLLEVAVRDTGIGIAKEDHDAVFEEFRQVGRNYTNKQEGTGLGLALTRRFVELHGGSIRIESEPGKGSTFTFTIPFARSAGEAPP